MLGSSYSKMRVPPFRFRPSGLLLERADPGAAAEDHQPQRHERIAGRRNEADHPRQRVHARKQGAARHQAGQEGDLPVEPGPGRHDPGGAGPVSVRVRTKGGTSVKSASGRFFYGIAPTVTKLSTRSGPLAGGTAVTITGKGFTGATVVSFGTIPAKKFTLRSSTQIRVTAPAGMAGPVDVRVANPAGTSAAVKADRFSYRKGAGTRISP